MELVVIKVFMVLVLPFLGRIKTLKNIINNIKYKYNVNIDAYFVSQFCPISNSVWSEKLTYGYLPHLKIPESRYMVYSAEDLKENSFFEQVERKLLLYGKYEQY